MPFVVAFVIWTVVQYVMVMCIMADGHYKTKRGLYWSLVPVVGVVVNFFRMVMH